uniref:Ground-like domain-containing protein n=1 Tax=Acrobeloides nanus TaxID=290746 RepID=A0A914CME7_9BILA
MLSDILMISIVFILLFSLPIFSAEDYLAEFDDPTETKKFGDSTPASSSRNYDAVVPNLAPSIDSYASGSNGNASSAVTKNQPEVANSVDLEAIEQLPLLPKSTSGGCGDDASTSKTSSAPGVAPSGCGSSNARASSCGVTQPCGVNSGSCGSPTSCGNAASPCSSCGTPVVSQPCQSQTYYPQCRPCAQPRPCLARPYFPQACPPPPSCPRPQPCNCNRQQVAPLYSPYGRPGGCGYGGCGGGGPSPYYQPNYYGGGRSVNDCCCNCRRTCRMRQQRTFALFGIKTISHEFEQLNALCNSMRLRYIIRNNISTNIDESKRRIQRSAEELFGHKFNVICGSGEFSYVVHTELYCQHTDLQMNITCYVFQPTINK